MRQGRYGDHSISVSGILVERDMRRHSPRDPMVGEKKQGESRAIP